jgi:hypothetical protein
MGSVSSRAGEGERNSNLLACQIECLTQDLVLQFLLLRAQV